MITCVDMFDLHDYGKVLSCRSQQNAVRWDFHSLVRANARHCFPSLPSFAPSTWLLWQVGLLRRRLEEEKRRPALCSFENNLAFALPSLLSEEDEGSGNFSTLNNIPFLVEHALLTGNSRPQFWNRGFKTWKIYFSFLELKLSVLHSACWLSKGEAKKCFL